MTLYFRSLLTFFIIFNFVGLSAQKYGEIKLDVYDAAFALLGVSYEYPVSSQVGVELKLGYDFYVPRGAIEYDPVFEYDEFTSHSALIKLAIRKYFTGSQEFAGWGLGVFSELQWQTYVEQDYLDYYEQDLGREYDLEQPQYLFVGVNGFFKYVFDNSLLIEANLEPSIDAWGLVDQSQLSVNLNLELKLGYRFGDSVDKG